MTLLASSPSAATTDKARVGATSGDAPRELTYTFDHVDDDPPASFTLTVLAFDDVGNNATYSVPVMLYNEIPDPVFSVERASNDSASSVLLNGSGVTDPEGDALTVTYTSSIDGVLSVGPLSWEGYLSRGVHTLTMEAVSYTHLRAHET